MKVNELRACLDRIQPSEELVDGTLEKLSRTKSRDKVISVPASRFRPKVLTACASLLLAALVLASAMPRLHTGPAEADPAVMSVDVRSGKAADGALPAAKALASRLDDRSVVAVAALESVEQAGDVLRLTVLTDSVPFFGEKADLPAEGQTLTADLPFRDADLQKLTPAVSGTVVVLLTPAENGGWTVGGYRIPQP